MTVPHSVDPAGVVLPEPLESANANRTTPADVVRWRRIRVRRPGPSALNHQLSRLRHHRDPGPTDDPSRWTSDGAAQRSFASPLATDDRYRRVSA